MWATWFRESSIECPRCEYTSPIRRPVPGKFDLVSVDEENSEHVENRVANDRDPEDFPSETLEVFRGSVSSSGALLLGYVSWGMLRLERGKMKSWSVIAVIYGR